MVTFQTSWGVCIKVG